MKKFLAMVVACTLTFGSVVLPTFEGGVTFNIGISASADEEDDYLVSGKYKYIILDDGTVEIKNYSGTEETVTIPETINGKTVTSIDNAFKKLENLITVSIPETVTNIGENAFFSCPKLTTIIIPESVTSIGENAFYKCSNLTNISLSSKITTIGYDAFTGSPWLKQQQEKNPLVVVNKILIDGKTATGNVTIPSNVEIINEHAFYNCAELTGITIPKTVTTVGNYSFAYCSKLNKVTISDGVTNLQPSCFYRCKSLTSIDIPDSVTNIEEYSFSECTELSKIKLPSNLAIIKKNTFRGCTKITEITIPDKVTEIEDYAFYQCSELSSITLPDSIKEIKDCAFKACTKLENISIPSSVTSIGNDVFLNTPWLTAQQKKNSLVIVNDILLDATTCNDNEITIPQGVRTIHYHAFYECRNLLSITFPDTVEVVEQDAFVLCDKLNKVTFSKNLKTLEEYAFWKCDKLTEVTIPKSVAKIGKCAFGYTINSKNNAIEKITGFTINCYKDSAAENFADENGFNKHVHNFGAWTLTKNATCTENGEEQRKCSCGEIDTKIIQATGHKYSEEWTIDKQPTCTEKGSKSHHCTVCGEKKDVTEIAATGHKYGSWTVTKKATCTSNGEQQRKCSDCGKIEKQTINALGHNLVKIKVVKPTLKSKGYTLYRCSRCGATIKKNYVPALVSISKAKVTGIKDITYTGKQIKPKITVKVGKTTLKNGRDYTVSYGKNKTVGKGTVTIIGKGKYGGKITKSFKILPAKTSAKLSSTKGKIKVTLKKAKGAKKYLIQISSNSKFRSAKTVSTTAIKKSFKAKSKKVYYVRVRTVNGKYASGWSAVRKIKVK